MRLSTLLFLPLAAGLALPPVAAQEEPWPVSRVSVDLAEPDPGAPFWSEVPALELTLVAQPMIRPRPKVTTTGQLAVQAVHDGAWLAIRMSWADEGPDEAGRLGLYSDAAAVQFPLAAGESPPPIFMGLKGMPVHIFHWRAQYQRDAEHGKPEMTDLYPHMSVDMYPMDFKEAKGGSPEDKETFSPGRATGNPQSYPKSGVDEIIAEGFATSAVQEGHSSAARGVWENGAWTVVITRPLVIEGGSTLAVGGDTGVAFAVWQGGKGEVGSRKSVMMSWLPAKVL